MVRNVNATLSPPQDHKNLFNEWQRAIGGRGHVDGGGRTQLAPVLRMRLGPKLVSCV